MRILLDAHDLISMADHGRPFGLEQFGEYLRAGQHEVVLSFTNIRELAGPLATNGDFLGLRAILQSLERLPHTFVKEATIVRAEIEAGVDAFTAGCRYRPCGVFVDRWDRTLVLAPGQRPATENWLNLRLDEIVYFIYRTRPDVFAPPHQNVPKLRQLLADDRKRLKTGQAPGRAHFRNAVFRHAERHQVRLPNGREDEFAEWLYANPDCCPGTQLSHETYRALMANYGDIPEASEFF